MKKKAVAIIRVSSKEQAQDERHSIPHQRQHIAEECEKRNFELVKNFEFVMSGAKVMKSSGNEQKEILNYIENNNIEVVIVHELDRLARSMIDTLLFVDELHNRKVTFISVHDGFDTSTSQGQLQMQILAAFAEYFRKQLADKVLGGMINRAQEARPMGRRPYGYSVKSGRFEIIEEEADIVREIFETYAYKNKGLRSIADDLNKRGYRTASGNKWSHVSIRDILDNEIYKGTFIWKDVRMEDAVPQIISKELYNLANRRRKERKELGGRSQNTTYLLSGLLRCGKCGSSLVGVSRKQKYKTKVYRYYYYRCNTLGSAGKNSCDSREYRARKIEEAVLRDLSQLLAVVPSKVIENYRIEPLEKANLEKDLLRVKKEITKANNMLERAAEAFEAGEYDLEFFSRRKNRITDQINELTKEKEIIERRIRKGLSREEIEKRVRSKLKSQPNLNELITAFVENETGEEKLLEFKKDLQQIISKVVVHSETELEVYYKL
ncbi:MAG: recombinase family protein [Thermoanaerobacteraceae bacterium]|nr:recombinase family protein [Thermoanaerobacteraceae bacterium]